MIDDKIYFDRDVYGRREKVFYMEPDAPDYMFGHGRPKH